MTGGSPTRDKIERAAGCTDERHAHSTRPRNKPPRQKPIRPSPLWTRPSNAHVSLPIRLALTPLLAHNTSVPTKTRRPHRSGRATAVPPLRTVVHAVCVRGQPPTRRNRTSVTNPPARSTTAERKKSTSPSFHNPPRALAPRFSSSSSWHLSGPPPQTCLASGSCTGSKAQAAGCPGGGASSARPSAPRR